MMVTMSHIVSVNYWLHFLFYFLVILFLLATKAVGAISSPVLKWQYGGCYSSWCETGWYSSPAVADLDGDGNNEVIGSAYSIVALDGNSGNLIWRAKSGHSRGEDEDNVGRTWPGIVITDVDGDSFKEIVTAHGGGYVSVYDHHGYLQADWPKRPATRELRGLTVDDIDNDGTSEVVVTGGVLSKTNTWVFEHDGSLRSGWPQLTDNSGYAFGVFNDNAWIADINEDKEKEILVPSDVHYICAYTIDGEQLTTNSQYGDKGWGKVGLWESYEVELDGGGDCSSSRAERYRNNMAHGAAVTADLDDNGSIEIIVTGNMYDCAFGHPPGKYTPLFIFNADRSRFHTDTWDWREPAKDTGAPLSEDYGTIEHCQPNPVVADIDGDKRKEILFSSYDGKLHCFWLDKTEHHNWPYSIYQQAEGFFRFSSEPVVADLDRDGKAEIIFTSWVEKKTSGSLRLGKLHILDYMGNVIHESNLPPPKSSSRKHNGALAAPTIANIDGDPDFELIVNSVYSGFIAYDLPGSAGAKILWHTGRNKQYNELYNSNAIISPILPLLLDSN